MQAGGILLNITIRTYPLSCHTPKWRNVATRRRQKGTICVSVCAVPWSCGDWVTLAGGSCMHYQWRVYGGATVRYPMHWKWAISWTEVALPYLRYVWNINGKKWCIMASLCLTDLGISDKDTVIPYMWLTVNFYALFLYTVCVKMAAGSVGVIMMTSPNGNIFHVNGPLLEEFTSHRWIPKASDVELRCFLWSAPE